MSQDKDIYNAQMGPIGMSESPFVTAVKMPEPDSEEMTFIPNGPGAEVNPADQDLFVGDFSFLKDLTSRPVRRPGGKRTFKEMLSQPMNLAFSINFLIGLLVVSVFFIWLNVRKEGQIVIRTPSVRPIAPKTEKTAVVPKKEVTAAPVPVIDKKAFSAEERGRLDEGISLRMADDLFAAGDYLKACYLYQEIEASWIVACLADEYVKDYLRLRMAICLYRAGEKSAYEAYFSQVLQSRSGYVRGMACYYLARIHFQNQEFLETRRRAYQSLALWKSYSEMVSANLEKDLYFLIAESLSREVLGFYSTLQELPGQNWADGLIDIWPTEVNMQVLKQGLAVSAERLWQGVGEPRVTMDMNRPTGSQWSLFCYNIPLEETLWKVISKSGMQATWKADLETVRNRPISAYLTYVPQQYLTEVMCGCAGLIWQFDGQKVSILDAEIYSDFEEHFQAMVQESIALWQRFVLRYRDDSRIANAHYMLGRMYTVAGQPAVATGEFKLLQGPFSQNPLAPYAYLEASKIKVEIKDYEGARLDLNTMLLEYPDCPIVDEATLYLGRATLESGKVELARDLFNKAFQMSISRGGKCDAALGLGRCAYLQEDWVEAKTWLARALELFEDKNDIRISSTCLMLGHAYLALGQDADASRAFRVALSGKYSEKEYVQLVLELINSESRQGNYLEALNILSTVQQEHLGQQELCELLIAKAGILREIDAAEEGVSLLRRKIEFIADSQMRAWLILELAKCYYAIGDYGPARRELNDALPDMGDRYRTHQSGLLLAQIAEKMGQPERAESLCISLLTETRVESDIRKQTFAILGRVYTQQKHYEKAALAFAGVVPQEGTAQ